MGLAAQMVVWDDEFLRMLAGKGVYVIRFDNRDIGLSTKFPQARTPGVGEMLLAQLTRLKFRVPYTLRDMAADTVGLHGRTGASPAAHVRGDLDGRRDRARDRDRLSARGFRIVDVDHVDDR